MPPSVSYSVCKCAPKQKDGISPRYGTLQRENARSTYVPSVDESERIKKVEPGNGVIVAPNAGLGSRSGFQRSAFQKFVVMKNKIVGMASEDRGEQVEQSRDCLKPDNCRCGGSTRTGGMGQKIEHVDRINKMKQ